MHTIPASKKLNALQKNKEKKVKKKGGRRFLSTLGLHYLESPELIQHVFASGNGSP